LQILVVIEERNPNIVKFSPPLFLSPTLDFWVQVDRINVKTLVKQPNSESHGNSNAAAGFGLFALGNGFGKLLVRSSVTAKDLFKGRNSIALAVLMRSPAIVLTWMPAV